MNTEVLRAALAASVVKHLGFLVTQSSLLSPLLSPCFSLQNILRKQNFPSSVMTCIAMRVAVA